MSFLEEAEPVALLELSTDLKGRSGELDGISGSLIKLSSPVKRLNGELEGKYSITQREEVR